jgi:hypothetical protein
MMGNVMHFRLERTDAVGWMGFGIGKPSTNAAQYDGMTNTDLAVVTQENGAWTIKVFINHFILCFSSRSLFILWGAHEASILSPALCCGWRRNRRISVSDITPVGIACAFDSLKM